MSPETGCWADARGSRPSPKAEPCPDAALGRCGPEAPRLPRSSPTAGYPPVCDRPLSDRGGVVPTAGYPPVGDRGRSPWSARELSLGTGTAPGSAIGSAIGPCRVACV